MQWQDEGIVIASRRHGERDCVLEVLTRRHGRHLGLVRGGRGPRHAGVLQPGNRLSLIWRARLEEHLGAFAAEVLHSRSAAVLADALALLAVSHIGALIRLLPERDPHETIYQAADGMFDLIATPPLLGPVLVRFELMILAELGFGLDLSLLRRHRGQGRLGLCLAQIRPRRLRRRRRPYAGRLLALPAFVRGAAPIAPLPPEVLAEGFALSGFFLERHLYGPRGLNHQGARAELLRKLGLRPEMGVG